MAITSANLANALVKLVAVDALPELTGELLMGNLVTQSFDSTVAWPGDKASINTGSGAVEIEITTHAEGTFQIPDVTKVIAVPDLLRLYMRPAIMSVAEKIESDLLGLCGLLAAHRVIGADQPGMTLEKVEEADTALFTGGVTSSEPKFLVTGVKAYSDLRRTPKFSEYQTAAEAGLHACVDGTVGKILNFFALRSQNVERGGSPALAHNIAFSKDALGMAIRRLPQVQPGSGGIADYSEVGDLGIRVVTNYQPNTLAQQYTIGILYGVRVLCDAHAVEVRS